MAFYKQKSASDPAVGWVAHEDASELTLPRVPPPPLLPSIVPPCRAPPTPSRVSCPRPRVSLHDRPCLPTRHAPTAFQCEVTGHSNLDYFQACRSEEREARLLHERFPSKLKAPLLRAVQFRALPLFTRRVLCELSSFLSRRRAAN